MSFQPNPAKPEAVAVVSRVTALLDVDAPHLGSTGSALPRQWTSSAVEIHFGHCVGQAAGMRPT